MVGDHIYIAYQGEQTVATGIMNRDLTGYEDSIRFTHGSYVCPPYHVVADGEIHTSWSAGYDVFTGRMNIDGSGWTDSQRTFTGGRSHRCELQVVDDKIHYVYMEEVSGVWQVFSASSNRDGSGWSSTQRTNFTSKHQSKLTEGHARFRVAGDKYYIAWSYPDDGGTWQIWTAEMNTDGTGWTQTQRTTGSPSKWRPELQVVGGKIYYTWWQGSSSWTGNAIWTGEVGSNIVSKGSEYGLGVSEDGRVSGFLNNDYTDYRYRTTAGTSAGAQVFASVDTAEWTYVAMTYDRSDLKLYVNGEWVGTRALEDTIPINTFDLMVGDDFRGTIDEVKISNRALSAGEIREHYELGSGTYYWNVIASDGVDPDTSETRYFHILLADLYVSPQTAGVPADSLVEISLMYDDHGDTSQALKGYDIKLVYDPAIVEVTDAYSGGFLGSPNFFAWDTLSPDTVEVTEARLAAGGVNGSGTLATLVFRGASEGMSSLSFVSVLLRNELNNPIASTTTGGLILVDGIDPSMEAIVEGVGEYYSTAPIFSNFGFDDNLWLDDGFYQMDSYAGPWNALFTDAPGTSWDSDGWPIPGFDALSEGTHTIYFMATDDAGNEEGESGEWNWQFYKDTTPPGDVTELTAEPGHEKVSLKWTNPTGKQSPLVGILIRRNAWGDYPEYAISAPGYPGSPMEGDSVAFLSPTETTYVDTISARDIYYYTAFALDSAGNYSSAGSGAQDRATSYWLGDVTDISTIVGNYDGYVDFEDLMIFSGCFASSEGGAGWEPEFDIGPTDDFSRTGIPEPDDVIDFEDLMIFAMNFWHTGPAVVSGSGVAAREVSLALDARAPALEAPLLSPGEEFEVKLVVKSGATLVKGMDMTIEFDPAVLEVVGVVEGNLFTSQETPVFFRSMDEEGRVEVVAAVLGTGVTLDEPGELALLTFRCVDGGETELRFSGVDLRGSDNSRLECAAQGIRVRTIGRMLPRAYALHQNYPNPFARETDIRYQIPQTARVSVKIYDTAGKLVRTLVDEVAESGYYVVHWDRRNENEVSAPAGVYFYRLTARGEYESYTFTRKMISLR